jgi:hypothetical protein
LEREARKGKEWSRGGGEERLGKETRGEVWTVDTACGWTRRGGGRRKMRDDDAEVA